MVQSNHQQGEFSTYEQAVQWIIGLNAFGIRPGLMRIEKMLELLDHPERRLKFIHVAGTNGKGSTCAFLTQVLIDSGYDVGTFTSPYIEKYTSRIEFNGQSMREEDLLKMVNRVKPIADTIAQSELGQPSMFEVTTAIALLYFVEVAFPNFVVWETGLGGRLDVTNIVHPIVSVITNIGHDHMDILGSSISSIAKEKAGIIKAGVPVVSAVNQPEAIEVIKQKAAEQKSTLYLLDEQFHYEPHASELNGQRFLFVGPFATYDDVPVSLNGAHQLNNAAVALMTLEVLRQYYAALIDEEYIVSGMGNTRWPGRFEIVSQQPTIVLDGAHNPEGAEVLRASLQQYYADKRIHFMIGMLASKDHRAYLTHILPLVDTLIVTEPDFGKKQEAAKLALLAEELLADMKGHQVRIIVEPSWREALQQLTQVAGEDDLAVVSGTLYLISDVRSWILHHQYSEKGW